MEDGRSSDSRATSDAHFAGEGVSGGFWQSNASIPKDLYPITG
jgi:hypothetical protein